ncbi:MAG: hypothetical protein ACI8X5_003871, partial [Planctomycetota bacterium]
MDELIAAHAFGSEGPVTSSPDGKCAYLAEGGAIALINADHDDPNSSGNFKTPLWRKQVGSIGVVPVEIAIDPGYSFVEPINANAPNSLLYIAGGRSGFWVMDAGVVDLTPAGGWDPYKATRIDNSGTTNTASQNSLRWCNDLKFMTVDGATYVVVLFARVDKSVLRVYDIEDVRLAAAQAGEFGNELAPLFNVKLQSIPNVSGDAYAFGMDVDEVDSTHSDIYVAMGEHGIFRVRFEDTTGSLALSTPATPVELGPYFGDSSPYVTHDSTLYGNVNYYKDDDE